MPEAHGAEQVEDLGEWRFHGDCVGTVVHVEGQVLSTCSRVRGRRRMGDRERKGIL